MKSVQNKKKARIRRFLSLVFRITALIFLFTSIFAAGYFYFQSKTDAASPKVNRSKNIKISEKVETPPSVNVLFIGVDKDQTRTDVMVIGTLDTQSKKMVFTSLPRDTMVEMPDEMIQELKDKDKHLPRSGIMKLNEIHAYSRPEGIEYLKAYLEDELLQIKIDYYVKVNLDGFRKIIDLIGGVEFDVPMDMKYTDTSQDLFIELKQGKQKLDGEHAEMLVRYRKSNDGKSGYKEGDIGRIKTQQAFIKEAIKQTLQLKNILKLPSLVSILQDDMETDFDILSDGMKYGKYLLGLNMENVKTQTLPGEPKEISRTSYFVAEEHKTQEMMQWALRGKAFEEKTDENIMMDSGNSNTEEFLLRRSEIKVKIYNGTNISGLASSVQYLLEDKGYKVITVGNYSKKGIKTTKIESQDEEIASLVKNDLKVGMILSGEGFNTKGKTVSIILGKDASFLK